MGKTMLTTSTINCIEERVDQGDSTAKGGALTIRCYLHPLVTTSPRTYLKPDRKLVFEAMTLFLRIESEVKEARADWNQDRFRRLMHVRSKAVCRLRRRWLALNPQPTLPLGGLRRRYHANLARYLHETQT